MSQDDFPNPQSGFVVTHFLVVADQDRSREFYQSVFGAEVLLERDPVIMKIANSWLILNVGGGRQAAEHRQRTDQLPSPHHGYLVSRPPRWPRYASSHPT